MNVSDEQIESLWAGLGFHNSAFGENDATALRSWLATILEQHVKAEIERMGKEPVGWYRVEQDFTGEYCPVVVWAQDHDEPKGNGWTALYAEPPDLQAHLDAVREECATEAWTHYMAACKKAGLAPANHEKWLASSSILSHCGQPSPLAQLQKEKEFFENLFNSRGEAIESLSGSITLLQRKVEQLQELANAYNEALGETNKAGYACMTVAQVVAAMADEINQLQAENAELRKLLTECKDSIAENLKELGGCDHSVGICMCSDTQLVSKIAEIFEDATEYGKLEASRTGDKP